MQVKVMKSNGEYETFDDVDHVAKKDLKDDGEGGFGFAEGAKLIGVEMEVAFRARSKPGITLQLPRDGSVIYTMNDKGDTTDTLTWPPREKAGSGFRALDR